MNIDDILKIGIKQGASDIHITVGLPPLYRINGRLVKTDNPILLPNDTKATILPMLKEEVLARFKKEGEVDFSYSIAELGRFRVNVFKQRGSVAAALRIVNNDIPTPEMLGIPESVISLANKKRGLVLVTGPTGSGKSTTLASIVDRINKTRDAHIITLEDPIEYLHRHDKSIVNQREIGVDSDSFADALRAALRQDPDVILVGEMRDLETISIAITAAETGHLVLSTLHTLDAASTIDRVIDVFHPHQQQQIRIQLSSVLLSVVSQQLMTTIDGRGRVAAFEVLHSNPAVRNMIRENKTHQIKTVLQTNRSDGMITLDESLIQLVKSGKIAREQALMISNEPKMLERRI